MLKFLKLARYEPSNKDIVVAKMKILQKDAKEQKMREKNEEEARLKEDQKRKFEERKNARTYVPGLRPKFQRSEKPVLQKKAVKKQALSEEQLDIGKYLGM